MTVNLFIIRHAESVPNVTPIIGGMRGDTGLTERGRGQARMLAVRLQPRMNHGLGSEVGAVRPLHPAAP